MKRDDITAIATITKEEIDRVEKQWSTHKREMDELERFIGTVDSYGSYPIYRPKLSTGQCFCEECIELGLFTHRR